MKVGEVYICETSFLGWEVGTRYEIIGLHKDPTYVHIIATDPYGTIDERDLFPMNLLLRWCRLEHKYLNGKLNFGGNL